MRTPAPADSLRVARALLRRSQRDIAATVGMSQKTLGELENGVSSLIERNLQLVDFYVANGIEFLGDAQIGKVIHCAGARWSSPTGPDAPDELKLKFRGEDQAINFGAARALVQKSQVYLAAALEVSKATIQQLEGNSIGPHAPAYEKLKRWYEKEGITFTGWGDVATGKFFGVGVRWTRIKAISEQWSENT